MFGSGPDSRNPAWPARRGPVRSAAGTAALRPVRLRDGVVWSRLRLRDEDYLRIWEPEAEGTWEQRFATMAWPVMCSGLRATARRGLALPFAITLDGRFTGQLTLGNVVRGSLRSAWVGYWVESPAAGHGG